MTEWVVRRAIQQVWSHRRRVITFRGLATHHRAFFGSLCFSGLPLRGASFCDDRPKVVLRFRDIFLFLFLFIFFYKPFFHVTGFCWCSVHSLFSGGMWFFFWIPSSFFIYVRVCVVYSNFRSIVRTIFTDHRVPIIYNKKNIVCRLVRWNPRISPTFLVYIVLAI